MGLVILHKLIAVLLVLPYTNLPKFIHLKNLLQDPPHCMIFSTPNK